MSADEVRLGGGEVRLDGSRLVVRRAGAGDRAALEAMFQRCSLATVYQRFHGQVRARVAARRTTRERVTARERLSWAS